MRDSSNAAYFCLSTEDPEDDVGMFAQLAKQAIINVDSRSRVDIVLISMLKVTN